MRIEAATLAGGEVNQDRHIIGPNFAAVFDGASTFGDNPSGYDGGWYAEQLATRLERLLTDRPDDDTANLVMDAITDIRDTYNLEPETSPTSTIALVRWNDETIECYVLGDSTIALIHTDGTETIITDDRIKQFGTELREKYRANLRAGGGFGEQHRATLAALQAEQAKHRNIEGGYWIAGAEPSVALHAHIRLFNVIETSSIYIVTDGIDLNRHPQVERWGEIESTPTQVLQGITQAEHFDINGSKYPRSKACDDKTLIRLQATHFQSEDSLIELSNYFNFDSISPILKSYLAQLQTFSQQASVQLQDSVSRLLPIDENFSVMCEEVLARFDEITKDGSTVLEYVFRTPENWQGIDFASEKDSVMELTNDARIPLAWVPDTTTLALLLEKPSYRSAHEVISDRSSHILNHCKDLVSECESAELRDISEFILEAISAHEEGYTRAAQALSSNILDTLHSQYIDENEISKPHPRNGNEKFQITGEHTTDTLVRAGIWAAYLAYDGKGGDPVPEQYSRHASAHGVSYRQYSPTNSLISIMHSASLIQLIENAIILHQSKSKTYGPVRLPKE